LPLGCLQGGLEDVRFALAERQSRPCQPGNGSSSKPDFKDKEFQFKTLWQKSLLHKCFTITHEDHAVQ
jgi:hypothetical protein